MKNYFDLQSLSSRPDWNGIRMGIDSECKERWKDRKSTMKKHFDKHGGYDDLESARANPHDSHTPEAWNKLIDELFMDPVFRARSAQNSENRGKQRYPSTGGSRSYAQTRYKNVRFMTRIV